MQSTEMVIKNTKSRRERIEAPATPSQLRRWFNFYSVGALGFAVQIATLASLKGLLGLDYLVATGLAVEVSVLHNFLWHERWTWADRTGAGHGGVFDRLVRFHAATAIISIVGNMVGTWLLVTAFDLHYLVANLLAVLSCSILNFFVSDLMVFRRMKEEAAALPQLQVRLLAPWFQKTSTRLPGVITCGTSRLAVMCTQTHTNGH